MRVIDLLNKIANGEEVPKKIKYKNDIYILTDNYCYYCDETNLILSDRLYAEQSRLNDEVEILEEEKKIPEKICTNRIINTNDILEFEMIQNKINAEYTYAINSIIDYLKSKGDE